MKRSLYLQILLGILCLVCHSSSAHATVGSQSSARIAYVVASGNAADIAAVEVVVRELVARLPVELQWSTTTEIDLAQVLAQRTPDEHVVARAWLDLSDPTRARIYIANAQDRRFVVRVVPLSDGYDEVGREVVGHIIESAVDAFLSGAEIGVSREVAERQVSAEALPPAPSPPPSDSASERQNSSTQPKAEPCLGQSCPSAARTTKLELTRAVVSRAPLSAENERSERLRLGLLVSYQITEIAALPTVLHGPALGLGLALPLRRALRFSSLLALHYQLPLAWDSPSVGARVAGVTARLSAGLEGDIARHVLLRGLLGVGADFLHLAPYAEPTDSSARAGEPLWSGSTIIAAMLTLEIAATSRTGLFIGAGCDANLKRPSYFVARDAQQTTVLSPWVFQPTATFGLAFRIDHPPIASGR